MIFVAAEVTAVLSAQSAKESAKRVFLVFYINQVNTIKTSLLNIPWSKQPYLYNVALTQLRISPPICLHLTTAKYLDSFTLDFLLLKKIRLVYLLLDCFQLIFLPSFPILPVCLKTNSLYYFLQNLVFSIQD